MREAESRLKEFLKKNTSKKKAIIVNSHNRLEELSGLIGDAGIHLKGNTEILLFKSRIPNQFGHLGLNLKISEDYLTSGDYKEIDDYIYGSVTKNWDSEIGKEENLTFTHRGIALARIAEYDFQLFLISRIKALTVIDRALAKEGYEAVFILDSNDELENFDELLQQHYRIPCDLISMKEKWTFVKAARRRLASFSAGLFDFFAGAALFVQQNKIFKKKTASDRATKLIDARLFYQLEEGDRQGVLLAPFERGRGLRLECLRKRRPYLGFEVRDGVFRRPLTEGLLAKPLDLRKNILFDHPKLKSAFVFRNIPYWTLIKNRIRELILVDFPRYRKNVDLFFNIPNIKSVILRNDIKELEKTVVLSARIKKIPSLVIQHGITAEPNGHGTIFADKIAVWGDYAFSWYRHFGNDAERIIKIGNPIFDPTSGSFNREGRDKDTIGKLGIERKERVIALIMPSPEIVRFSAYETDDISYILLEETAKAVKSVGDINLIVKLHPNENIRDFIKLVDEKDRKIIKIIDKIDIRELIKISDLVIITETTVGLEAIAMGKPVLMINLTKRESLIPYVENGVAAGIHDTGEIENAIKRVLDDKGAKGDMNLKREGFVNHFLYLHDGNARKRASELIKKF